MKSHDKNWRVPTMWNTTVRANFKRGVRRSVVTTAILAGSLGLGTAIAQNTQDAPPAAPPASEQQPGPGMGGPMGHRPMESVDDQIKHLSKKLKLTDDQQA